VPLLDHFHPPLDRTHPWKSFHNTWAVAMARLLNNGVLPPGFYAIPTIDRGGPIEIDVAALHEPGTVVEPYGVQAWAPEAPAVAVTVEWPDTEAVRVEIRDDSGETPLAAAVELVSPGNKDRRESRQAFAEKCADYLRHGSGVVVVDVVTNRRANLHAEVMETLGLEPTAGDGGSLSAVAYRPLTGQSGGRLEAWPVALAVGQPLPTLPLWLHGEFPVRLDLEASHTVACNDLRIRLAG
jgi:hypothetical protein